MIHFVFYLIKYIHLINFLYNIIQHQRRATGLERWFLESVMNALKSTQNAAMKIKVAATGEIKPTTDCPKAKEFEVFLGNTINGWDSVGYVVANTKKWALELANDLVMQN